MRSCPSCCMCSPIARRRNRSASRDQCKVRYGEDSRSSSQGQRENDPAADVVTMTDIPLIESLLVEVRLALDQLLLDENAVTPGGARRPRGAP